MAKLSLSFEMKVSLFIFRRIPCFLAAFSLPRFTFIEPAYEASQEVGSGEVSMQAMCPDHNHRKEAESRMDRGV